MALPAAAAATGTGITGTVTNGSSATHPPIAGAQVCVTPKGGGSTTCTSTDAKGEYTIEGLEAKEYSVEFTGNVCMGLSCNLEYVKQVHVVTVKLNELATLNAGLLEIDGKISGRVTSGGAALPEITVCASGSGYGCTNTDANGEYTINHLPKGSYTVSFRPRYVCKIICQSASNYIFQYFNGQPTFESANAVVVNESETTAGINAELRAGGHIAGRVTNASIYAQPLASVVVCANFTITNKEGEREGERECALTNAGGEYSIQALASGGYEVEFTGEACVEAKGATKCTHPYIAQFFQGIVSVSAPGTTTGINGSLLEGSPSKPLNTAAPTVTTAQTLIATVHPLLSCSNGTWSNNPTSLTYKWLRNGTAITGQTANTYTAQDTDAGAAIACEVTASNAAGAAAALSSTVQIPKLPGVAVFHSASVKGTTVSITLRCTGTNACSGTVELLVRVTSGHGKNRRTRNTPIGKATFSIALSKSATVRIHLTGAGSRLLAHAGRKGLKVQIAGQGVKAHAVMLKPSSKHPH